MEVRRFDQHKDREWWDGHLCKNSPTATFLHSRPFLSYHGDRFRDVSLIVIDGNERPVGALPAAISPEAPRIVICHPGLTYGGLLPLDKLYGDRVVEAFQRTRDHFRAAGFVTLLYKAVPPIFHKHIWMDDRYALYRLKASLQRVDLSSAIDMDHRRKPSQRRLRGLKRALSHGIVTQDKSLKWRDFWTVLEANLESRHKLRPTHSFQEISLLRSRFPENIELVVGIHEGTVVAGVVLFHKGTTSHSQYIAASPRGFETNALDAVLERCIEIAENRGARFFSFGVSTEDSGQTLNQGLYEFKRGFGASGVVHEHYAIDLT